MSRDSTIAKVPVHARDLLLQLESVMYARYLQTGSRIEVPKHIATQVVELRSRSYRRLDHALRVLQGFVVVVSQPYFSFIVPRLLALEAPFAAEPIPNGSTTEINRDLLKDSKQIEKEPEDTTMYFYVMHTLYQVLQANTKTNPRIESGVREFLFEFLLTQLSNANTLRRLNVISQCLSILSQYQLAELCEFIIGKLKSAKLTAQQFKVFQQTVREFDFGIARPMQRQSTLLYIRYQVEAMDDATKEITKKEICDSLVYIFSKILQKDKTLEESEERARVTSEWNTFCKSNEASKFWGLIDDLYRNLSKWAKAQKGKSISRYSTHRLMAMIVGFSRNSTRDSFVDPLIRSVVSQFKGIELCVIFHDFLSNLPFSNVDTNNIPEAFQVSLELIIETLIQFNECLSDEMTDLLIDTGIEIGRLGIRHSLRISLAFMAKDELALRFVGVSILRITAQMVPEDTDAVDNSLIYKSLLNTISGPETIVLQRDQDYDSLDSQKTLAEDEKPASDLNEIVLTAALCCFPLIDHEPAKHLSLLERIVDLCVSPVFSVAESALFTIRDYILINPGSHLVYSMSLLLKQTIDYLSTNECHLRRIFYNASTILYYINQAVENDFGMDGLNIEKFVLLRNQWEGSLLVWLCHPAEWIHNIAWRLLEQLSSPQMRQLEVNAQQKAIPHLIDSLPRPTLRNSGGDSLIPLLPEFVKKNYDTFYLCINWAWSNLYRDIVPLFLKAKPGHGVSIGDNFCYLKFLCIAPSVPPSDVSFEVKHHFLSSGALARWFSYIAVAIKERLFDRRQLVECIQSLHPSCNKILLQSIFSSISIENVATVLPCDSEFTLNFDNSPHVMSIFSHLLQQMTAETFMNENFAIRDHFVRLLNSWFTSRMATLNKLTLSVKRDFLSILTYCIRYSNNLSAWLPCALQKDSHSAQINFIAKIIKKILPPESKEAAVLHIAVDCAAVQLLVALSDLQPLQNNWDKWETTCLAVCSRGTYLQEFTEILFFTYTKQNPQRFPDILHYCISTSPSITQTPVRNEEYVLCLPLLRSIMKLLCDSFQRYNFHIFHLFFTSLFFQCSFDVNMRAIAIELAFLISSPIKPSTTPIEPSTGKLKPSKPFLGTMVSSFKDSFDNIILDLPRSLDSCTFLPCASHTNREVYITLTERYSKEISLQYAKYTRDVLRAIIDFNSSITCSTDIEMMLRMMKCWVSNFGSSVVDAQTSRWIIRAVFEISYVYVSNDSLTLCIQELWSDLASSSEEEIRMALDWLISFCGREIQRDSAQIDFKRIQICTLAVGNLVRYGSTRLSQFAVSFLLDHLRNFSFEENVHSVDVWNGTRTRKNTRAVDEYKERAVLILLVPLVMGDKKLDFSKCLSLLLHHSFVVDRIPSDICYLNAGEDLIANLLLGMEMRPSLVPGQQGNTKQEISLEEQTKKLKRIRRLYFPDTGAKAYCTSELNPYRALEVSASTVPSSKTKRKKSKNIIRPITHFPLFVSINKITRFIDLLETVNSQIRSEWASLAFEWSLAAPNISLAVNSFAVYATLVPEISYNNIVEYCLRVLRNRNFESFQEISAHFLDVLQRHWFSLEIKSFVGLTAIAIVLLQCSMKELFKFGLEILVSLFGMEEQSQHFHEAITRTESVWKTSRYSKKIVGDGEESIDKIIASYLVRGLCQSDTMQNTLWLAGMIYSEFASKVPCSNNYLLVLVLLSHHVISLPPDRSQALDSYKSIKQIDHSGDVSSISVTFKKFHKETSVDEYLELFYCEFASIYPDEDVFFFCLNVLEDFTLGDNESLQLASIAALGNFLHLNYIHDISLDECELLMDRIMIGVHCNASNEKIVDSLQTLLLFLLSDPRANRPKEPFGMIFNAEALKGKQNAYLGGFDDSSVPEEILFEMLREPLQEIENLKLSGDWHMSVMQAQNAKKLGSILAEEENKSKIFCDARLANRTQRSMQKLYPVIETKKTRRKKKTKSTQNSTQSSKRRTKKTNNTFIITSS